MHQLYGRHRFRSFGVECVQRRGSIVFTGDGAWHQTSFSYTDSFSDSVNRNTYAYPTTITDADSYSTTVQYNYDFGAVTRTQDPKGAMQTTTYDNALRVDRITNQTSTAYVRYVYSPLGYIASFATMQDGAGEAYSINYFDGAGRVRASGGDHPGSAGGYMGQLIFYDAMGRLSQKTNPAEINASWVPTGDDAAGWSSTLQTYDWQGRPLLTTNPDGNTRETIYGGCGCAGGEQTTVRDEQGRRKRYTNDVLGRLVKVEELNWDTTVYSTTNYTLTARDQVTQINQEGQLRTYTYDGYGRVATRTTPEQGATSFTYFADDTVQTITDARNATATFAYNGRHLATSITYLATGAVAATPNVSFTYDSGGNRTSMTDGLGSVSYVYNTLSQLTSETRTFNGLAGSFTLSYGYNLAGQLNSITNPWGAQVGYHYNKIGRPTSVSGAGYVGVSAYVNNITYRAFGIKQVAYNNGRTLSIQYDNRLRKTEWSVPGALRMQYNYTWERDGRVGFARNLDDETLDRYYGYDHVGRLTVSRSGNEARLAIGEQVPLLYNGPYSHGYFYDKWGNITGREGWGGTNPVYNVSYNNNRMNGMVYDAAGNLTDAGGGWSFTYDVTGQQATSAVGNMQNWYDGDRLRGKKVESGTTVYYLRSSLLGGQVVAELAANGDWARGYVYLGSELLAIQFGGVYWVHQDPVVKSKRITDASGTVVSSVELDPWGGETNRSSNEGFQPRKFNTYHRDGIGSDDAMHRRYNRWWTRFEQPDPYDGSYNLSNPQSFNRYSYAQNDPINFIDPTGLFCVWRDRWDEVRATLYVWQECYFEGGGGGGSGGPQDPRPQPHPTPTPAPPTPTPDQNPYVEAVFGAIHGRNRQTDRARTAISNLLAQAAPSGLTAAQAAYVLATAEHESNMGNSMVESRSFAATRNYGGGVAYRGRGYVHLTHRSNYARFGLAGNPAQATRPEVGARVAVQGMVNGSFTGRSLEDEIPANGEPDFYNARWIIIGQTRHERGVAQRLAANAKDFLTALQGCGLGQ